MTDSPERNADEADEEISGRSDLRLTARYRWLLLAVVLPLFLVISVLAVSQYRDQHARVLRGLEQNCLAYAIALEGIAKAASDHVTQMKAWSENYLRSPPSYPSDLRAYYTPLIVNGSIDSYTLDKVPQDRRRNVGQLAWLGKDPRQPDVGEVELDQALEFFSLARLTHDVTPYFQWSYFFPASREFVAVYPWFSADDIMTAGGYESMNEALAGWFEYEVYQAGTPENNPRRVPFSTGITSPGSRPQFPTS